jgi:Putative zinc-finger
MHDSSNNGPLRFLKRLRMHPTNADLVAYRDGELSPGNHSRVKQHLQLCERCQNEALAIEEDLLIFGQLAHAAEIDSQEETGLRRLQEAMDARVVTGGSQPASGTVAEVSPAAVASVSKELAIYLGAHAAEKLLARLRTTTFSVEDLVASIGPLMVGLLGNRGGSAVTGKIALLCGSSTKPASGPVTQ